MGDDLATANVTRSYTLGATCIAIFLAVLTGEGRRAEIAYHIL